MVISASCTMPSALMSAIFIRVASTAAQLETQAGRAAKLEPTRLEYTSNLASTASAGAVKYSRKMKNIDQNTDLRASRTEGVV